MSASVAFEPGYAVIAGTRYAIRDIGTHGAIQLGGEDGLVLRPLTYGERSRLIGRLAGAPNTVGAAVLRAATVQSGAGDRSVAEILALVLAGANADAPPFATTLLTVAGAAGWSLRDIDDADAETIDQLAMQLGAVVDDPDDGWSRIVLVDDARATSLDEVRRELAERLIARAGVVAHVTAEPAADSSAVSGATGSPLVTPTAEVQPWPVPDVASVSEADLKPTPGAMSAPSAPDFAGEHASAPNSAGGPALAPDTPRRLLGVTGTNAATSTLRERSQVASAEVRPKFRLLGATDRAAAAPAATAPTTEPSPINRVSYQPEAGAAQRSLNPQPLPPKQPLNTAPTLELVRAPQSATPIPLPAPNPAPVEAKRLSGWQDASAHDPAPTFMPTLAQIETLVGDEVADALAALLDHEADLRGIDR